MDMDFADAGTAFGFGANEAPSRLTGVSEVVTLAIFKG